MLRQAFLNPLWSSLFHWFCCVFPWLMQQSPTGSPHEEHFPSIFNNSIYFCCDFFQHAELGWKRTFYIGFGYWIMQRPFILIFIMFSLDSFPLFPLHKPFVDRRALHLYSVMLRYFLVNARGFSLCQSRRETLDMVEKYTWHYSNIFKIHFYKCST